MPPPATPASAGHLGDLSGAKVKRYEGSVAKSLSIEIVRVVFALFSNNARVFLQECQRARASSPWAASARGPRLAYGPPHACVQARCAAWAVLDQNQFSFFVENRNSFSFVFLS